MSLSLELASRLGGISIANLPGPAIHAAELALADALCVMLAATKLEPATEPFHRHALAAGKGNSTLLAGGTSSPSLAALANGSLSHALDFEDTYDAAGLHPNAIVIPAALALAEAEGVSGADLLLAIASGCDIACRIGDAMASDPANRGWYHPPMIAAAGAAFGVSRMLRLTPEQSVSAASLTLCQFALTDELKRSPLSDLRAIRDGFAARAVVEACLLAREGVSGVEKPLEGQSGLFALLTDNAPSGDILEEFGARFHGPEVSLKEWPCCRGTHPYVAQALVLRNAGWRSTHIAQVQVSVQPPDDMLMEPQADRTRPATMVAAKFSIPFAFALAMERGVINLDGFGEAARADERILSLAARFRLGRVLPRNSTERPSLVVTATSGAAIKFDVPEPPYLFARETSLEDMDAKFRGCLVQAGRPQLTTPLLDALRESRAAKNLQALTGVLRTA